MQGTHAQAHQYLRTSTPSGDVLAIGKLRGPLFLLCGIASVGEATAWSSLLSVRQIP